MGRPVEVLRTPALSPAARFPVKICDVTQFYSPVSGGVKRYISEKRQHVLDHTRDEGFIRPQHRELVLVESDVEKLLRRMKAPRLPAEVKRAKRTRNRPPPPKKGVQKLATIKQ